MNLTCGDNSLLVGLLNSCNKTWYYVKETWVCLYSITLITEPNDWTVSHPNRDPPPPQHTPTCALQWDITVHSQLNPTFLNEAMWKLRTPHAPLCCIQ